MNTKRLNDHTLQVTLSRRNLASLLTKLMGHPPNSHCTLIRACDDGTVVVLKAEPDEVHYAERQPGVLHPDTDSAMNETLGMRNEL